MAGTLTLVEDTLKYPSLASFDIPQLRELVLAYTKSPDKIPRSRGELLEQIQPYLSDAHFLELLEKLETIQPYKHTYVYGLNDRQTVGAFQERLRHWVSNYDLKPIGETQLKFLGARTDSYITLRLAQFIRNFVYLPSGPTTLELTEKLFRHAVIIAVKPELGIVEVRFDGFEQSRDTPQQSKIQYTSIAEDCRALVETIFGEPVRGLALKESIEKMLAKHTSEVTQLKINSRYKNGRISIDSGEEDDADLMEFMASAFAVRAGQNGPLSSMKDWTAEQLTLRWTTLKILTRVDLTGSTPEILFFWKRGSEKITSNSDYIIKRLVEHSDLSYAAARKRISEIYPQCKNWGVFTALKLAQSSNAALDDCLGFLLEKVATTEIVLKFRVNTTVGLRDIDNKWLDSLADLPPEVHTQDNKVLPLEEMKNIEVGFYYVGGRV